MSEKPYAFGRVALALGPALAGLIACAPRDAARPPAQESPRARFEAAVADPGRPSEDRERDAVRRPIEYLALLGLAPGDRVLELGAGWGYMAYLAARVVGPNGQVVAHNPPDWAAYPAPAWSKGRAEKAPPGVWVDHVAPWDAPIPAGARFDVVLSSFAYHEVVIAKADRDAMNLAVYAALVPGGLYVVADHHAAPGTSMSEVARLHRIDEQRVRREIERAGFELVRSSPLYENADDALAEPTCCERFPGAQHRFILLYRRPERS